MTEKTNTIDPPLRPRETFETILAAARLAAPTIKTEDGREIAILPGGFTFNDISSPYLIPPYARATQAFDEKQSLIDYVNRFRLAGTILVADFDRLSVRAVIDYHKAAEVEEPGAVAKSAHTATMALRPSEEWVRWDAFEGDLHDQTEFAVFIEENATDIIEPEAATMIEISRDLEAVQGASFKSSIRLENGDRSFQYQTETSTRNDVVVPKKFMLSIPIYQGEPPVELTALLRWKATAGGIMFGFQWHRVTYQRLSWFRQIATEIAENTGVPVFYGRLP